MIRQASALLAASAALIAIAVPANAAVTPYTFNMTGNMADNGTYGNSLTLAPTSGASALNLKVTGWQAKQDTNAITSAYIGKYSAGMGVTGLGDQSGSGAQHQVDNAFGYYDFFLLQFDKAVTLTSANLNAYQITGVSGIDNDLGYYAATIATPAWDSAINLSAYSLAPSLWTNVAGNGTSGTAPINTATASTQWLLGAGINTGHNDGFKLASLTVGLNVPQPPAAAVPEPATWGLMILGFGMVGAAARRRSRHVLKTVAA